MAADPLAELVAKMVEALNTCRESYGSLEGPTSEEEVTAVLSPLGLGLVAHLPALVAGTMVAVRAHTNTKVAATNDPAGVNVKGVVAPAPRRRRFR